MRFQVSSLVSNPRIASGMRLVEGIAGELFPVAPYLFQHLGVVSVSLSLCKKLRFHLVYNGFLLFPHCLAQGIALATGEVCKLATQQHYLLLVDRNAISVFQILLHAGNVVLNQRRIILAFDKVGNVVHRSRAIERIHCDKVFEHSWVQFAQILLHSRRFKLERPHSLPSLIKLIGKFVINRNVIDIDYIASGLLYYFAGFFNLGQRFKTEEVHLYKSCCFYDVPIVLRYRDFLLGEIGVGSRRDRNPVADRVAANNEPTRMNASAAHRSFQHLRILYGISFACIFAHFSFL